MNLEDTKKKVADIIKGQYFLNEKNAMVRTLEQGKIYKFLLNPDMELLNLLNKRTRSELLWSKFDALQLFRRYIQPYEPNVPLDKLIEEKRLIIKEIDENLYDVKKNFIPENKYKLIDFDMIRPLQEHKIYRLVEERDAQQDKITNLEKTLQEKENTIMQTLSKPASVEEHNKAFQEAIELRTKVDELNSQNQVFSKTIEQLKSQLMSQVQYDEYIAQTKKLEEAKLEIEQLNKSVKGQKFLVNEYIALNDEAVKEIERRIKIGEELDGSQKMLKSLLEKSEDRINRLDKKILEQTQEINELNNILDLSVQAGQKWKDKFRDVQEDIEKANNQIDELSKTYISKMVSEAISKIQPSEEQIKEMSDENLELMKNVSQKDRERIDEQIEPLIERGASELEITERMNQLLRDYQQVDVVQPDVQLENVFPMTSVPIVALGGAGVGLVGGLGLALAGQALVNIFEKKSDEKK